MFIPIPAVFSDRDGLSPGHCGAGLAAGDAAGDERPDPRPGGAEGGRCPWLKSWASQATFIGKSLEIPGTSMDSMV